MDIHNSIIDIYDWIKGTHKKMYICVIMDIYDSIKDAHIWIMDT